LTAIKGLGQSAVNAITEARSSGPFRSFFDFADRVETSTLNKRGFESLVSAGAFDSLKDARSPSEWRGALHDAIDPALARAQRAKRERQQGQNGLFGATQERAELMNELPAPAKAWSRVELLAAEKAALGFYITGHPLEGYVEVLQNLKATRSSDLPSLISGSRVTIGGIIAELQLRTTKKGDKFALLRLEDEAGGTKCVLWPEVYRKHAALLQNDLAVVTTGRLELSEDNPPTIIADQVQSMEAISKSNEFVVLRTPQQNDFPALLDAILSLLSAYPGNCDVALETVVDDHTIVRIKANSALRISRSSELEQSLRQLGCAVSIEKATPAFASDNERSRVRYGQK
jgi:DNA polymerase-3 subunit alpha